MMILYKDIKSGVEKELGYALQEDIWQDLFDDGYVGDVETGAESVEWLADKVRERFRLYDKRRAESEEVEEMLDRKSAVFENNLTEERLRAISVITAEEARKNRSVQEFRRLYLNDVFLRTEQIENWIFDISKSEGGKTVKFEMLPYAIPDDPFVRRFPAIPGGVLDKLRLLGERLSSWYGWQEAQATIFLLTDKIPQINPMKIRIRARSRVTAATRVVMEIDPALTPSQVSEKYVEVRNDLFGRQYRSLSKKHILLAEFAALRPQNESWLTSMNAWNKQWNKRPGYKYSHISNFHRDCKKAEIRLLSPIHWNQKLDEIGKNEG